MAPLDWLLDSDPSIRWQVLRDLADAPSDVVAAERARVAHEGWGARLLGLQEPDGQWGGGTYHPYWTSTTFTLLLLRELGLDPACEAARRAADLVQENLTLDDNGQPFFDGETEPCINGMVLAAGAYFGHPSTTIVERLLGEQLEDGGWNCEAPTSQRSSFHSTICVLEGLLEYERARRRETEAAADQANHTTDPATGAPARANEAGTERIRAARARAHEYLFERRMFRTLSTGAVIDPDWTLFSFPTWWHYDVLRGLDYLRSAGVRPDERIAEVIDLVRDRRGDDGRWPLQNPHPGEVHFAMDEGEGRPSRWITLRALRVLRWAGHAG
jgi:hypothetical protein